MSALLLMRHLVDSSRRDVYDAAVAGLLERMRGADGFLWADASASVSEPELVTILSEWRSGAQLDAFLERDEGTLADQLDVCLREDASFRRFVDA